jgi:tRNA-dihydrouridine synthase B
VRTLPGGEAFREHMNTLDTAQQQLAAVANFLDGLANQMTTKKAPASTNPSASSTPKKSQTTSPSSPPASFPNSPKPSKSSTT